MKKNNAKILKCAGIVICVAFAAMFALLLLPSVQSAMIDFVERSLRRELRRPKKWISLIRCAGIVGLTLFSCLPFVFRFISKKFHLSFSNLRSNAVFLISCTAFFMVFAKNYSTPVLHLFVFIASVFIAIVALAFFSSREENFFSQIKDVGLKMKIFCGATSLGICACIKNISFLRPLGIVGSCVALPAVFFFVCLFWKYIISLIKRTEVFDGIQKPEISFYVILAAILSLFSWMAFLSSEAFYGGDWDTIYTSDHPNLISDNVYFNLYGSENDIRQPLFALFASPILGAFYPFLRFLPENAVVVACLLGSAQIVLIVFSFFLVARTMDFSPVFRAAFVLFCCSSYTGLLSCIMMEQYVIATFYLAALLFVARKKIADKTLMFACGGTLITSFFFFPLSLSDEERNGAKRFVLSSLKLGAMFVGTLLVAGRFDVIWNCKENFLSLLRFGGGKLIFSERLSQYSIFIKNLFALPSTNIIEMADRGPSWQLASSDGKINAIGILVFALCLVSFVLNRKRFAAKVSFAWMMFSFVLLCAIGWGTAENGMILYSLYFFWAFAALLFMFAQFAFQKTRLAKLPHSEEISFAVICVISLVMLAANVPSIAEMIIFAHENYPAWGGK